MGSESLQKEKKSVKKIPLFRDILAQVFSATCKASVNPNAFENANWNFQYLWTERDAETLLLLAILLTLAHSRQNYQQYTQASTSQSPYPSS